MFAQGTIMEQNLECVFVIRDNLRKTKTLSAEAERVLTGWFS